MFSHCVSNSHISNFGILAADVRPNQNYRPSCQSIDALSEDRWEDEKFSATQSFSPAPAILKLDALRGQILHLQLVKTDL